jgi:hypothetical protein
MSNVWVLTILHRHGQDITVHATPDSAQRWLHNYVDEWWHELDINRHVDESLVPRTRTSEGDLVLTNFEDVEDPVTTYFDAVEDEHANIEEMPILNIEEER